MNMYKGPMDKANQGRIKGGRWGWVGWGKVVVGKWRQLYQNINLNFFKECNKTKMSAECEKTRIFITLGNIVNYMGFYGKQKVFSGNKYVQDP